MSAPEIVVPFDPNAAPARNRKPQPRFIRKGVADIMATHFDPIRWAIPDYMAEGLTILAGRQKLGKTWLALDWAIAVGTGGVAMGSIPCEQGNVLYIDMENGHRRIKDRVNTLLPNAAKTDLSGIEIVTEAMTLDKGFIPALDDWWLSVPHPRLVVIDVLQRVKPTGNAARNSYENDYAALAELQKWAVGNGVAILALHHTRKGGADDPLEALSGSNGLSACADTTIVLDRNGTGTTLYVRGRDVEEKETALAFSGGIWSITGEADQVRATKEQGEILNALMDADEAMTPNDIAIAVGKKRGAVDTALYRMAKAGLVNKVGRGKYRHPERDDLNTAD